MSSCSHEVHSQHVISPYSQAKITELFKHGYISEVGGVMRCSIVGVIHLLFLEVYRTRVIAEVGMGKVRGFQY